MIVSNDKHCTFTKPIVTMGTFDGVHPGHLSLLKKLVERARAIDGEAVVLTYYHHPLETLNLVTRPYLLTEKRLKEQLLRKAGVDSVLYLKFTPELSRMEPDEFLKSILLDKIKAREIVVGYDTHFGRNRRGNYYSLSAKAAENKFKVRLVAPCRIGDVIISSSVIRNFLKQGDTVRAAKFLGRQYSVLGKVVHGFSIGSQLGFPTINLEPEDPHKLIPAPGVYATRIKIGDTLYNSVTNIGVSPTVRSDERVSIETFVLDFSEEIYHQNVELVFYERLRSEKYFDSLAKLKEAIIADIARVRKNCEFSE
ncbi:MAG: bifunctional riboflavin kinase/FAD synthetase [Candidatus Cloacimonetes bacterium]|nr:bifunctional riboflavin kinase/FAD synthetase [Candidatus Cloacimonadota bacterium]